MDENQPVEYREGQELNEESQVKAIDGDQVTWETVTSGDIFQITTAAESLHRQILDITKYPLLPNLILDSEFALLNSRSNIATAISEAFLAQSETALEQFNKATLIPELKSLSSTLSQQLVSHVNSSFTSSLAGIVLEAMPKIDLSDLLPKYTVNDLFLSLDLNTHLIEITKPLLDNIGASLTGVISGQLQRYFESSPFHMGQLDLGNDISASIDSLLRRNHVVLAAPIYLNRRESYLDEQYWFETVLHKEIQTEDQLLQGQQEIMARLERLEKRISQTTTPRLPDPLSNTPPIPGQKNATWEDVFDWYYGAPRRWCLDLKDLADKIGMAYGTVKKEHSLYNSDKKLLHQ